MCKGPPKSTVGINVCEVNANNEEQKLPGLYKVSGCACSCVCVHTIVFYFSKHLCVVMIGQCLTYLGVFLPTWYMQLGA